MNLQETTKQILPLIDLTSLNASDSDSSIQALCHAAHTAYGNTAAVCVYPQFISIAQRTLALQHTPEIKVATVSNFPAGNASISQALKETLQAVEAGADEVDIVLPYTALVEGNYSIAETLISEAVRLINHQSILKVIIESGELKLPPLIQLASEIAIDNGADFIKTSTGKVPVNATLDAAFIMLQTIAKKNSSCGFKAAGGIRTVVEAQAYINLATELLGIDWLHPTRFRFGASALLQDVLSCLKDQPTQSDALSY